MKNAVAILSGGLDSTVSLARAIDSGFRVREAIFFDYGQKARRRERAASRSIARHFGVAWREIALPWLRSITRTSLVGKKRPPKVSERDLDGRRAKETAKAVWVPNRNGVFLNIAAAVAESRRAATVLTGFDREEAATFPDNSVEYIRAANRAFHFSTANHVKVRSFVAGLDKTRIVKLGIELNVPFRKIWSCYLGGSRPCGECESCRRSIRAYRRNGL
jgi:7-cyano-7-deazaguanine synthase